jgi:hypothetical protein
MSHLRLPSLDELPPYLHRYRSRGLPFHKERCAFQGCGEDADHPNHQLPSHTFESLVPGDPDCRGCGMPAGAAIHQQQDDTAR